MFVGIDNYSSMGSKIIPVELQNLLFFAINRIVKSIKRVNLAYFRLSDNGIKCKTVGVGSTPTASQPVDSMQRLTELHPGNYIFMGESL